MRIEHRALWFLKPLGFLIQVVLGIGIACMCSLLIVSQSSSPKVPVSLHPKDPGSPLAHSGRKEASETIYDLPVRLKIPKIGVDTAIEKLGISPDGNMQAPAKAKNAGWYKFGPQPGNKGSAVIAGHFGSGSYRGKSVFDDLHTLSKGDTISIEDEAGAMVVFVVREFRIYNRNEIVPEVFNSGGKEAHLNLITCEGVWDASERTYARRLVVFTDKNRLAR